MQHGPTPVPTGPGIGRRNDVYVEDLIPGNEFNYSTAGSWEVPVPQPHNQSRYMMVRVFHMMARDVHPLILSSHEADCSI